MLTCSPIGGDGSYWLDLAQANYRTESGEPLGRWGGSGAFHFAMAGKAVQRKQLVQLLQGFSPKDRDCKLVSNAGSENRQRGHDFTFNAPKSVSIAWAAANEQTRRKIASAHKNAVDSAIKYLEKHATFTRRGKNGKDIERAKLLVATFEHSTSRAEDPHLHTHAVVANVCVRFDGTTGTLFSKVSRDKNGKVIERLNPLYRNKMAAGAIYRMALSHELQTRLGFGVRESKYDFGFELDSISDEAIKHYSTRRKEIEAQLELKGFVSAKASEIATLDTRKSKTEVNRTELFRKWRSELRTFGIDENLIKTITKQNPKSFTDVSKLLSDKAKSLADVTGGFELKKLFQSLATELETNVMSYDALESAIDTELTNGDLVLLGEQNLDLFASTQEIISLEHDLIGTLQEAKNDCGRAVEGKAIEAVLAKPNRSDSITLSKQQCDAVRYLTGKVENRFDGIRVLTGDAGSGKTTVLKTAKKVWDTAGYRVVGAALSGKAAEELEQHSGIGSHTISKWNYHLKKSGLIDQVKHHGEQLVKASKGMQTQRPNRDFKLDSKSVLVIDEAAMADTHQLNILVGKAVQAKSLIALVGDDKQCQAIGHGGAFVAATRTLGTFRLSENWRQVDEQDALVAKLFSEGNSNEALRNLAKRGRVKVSLTESSAVSALVKDWQKC